MPSTRSILFIRLTSIIQLLLFIHSGFVILLVVILAALHIAVSSILGVRGLDTYSM